MLIGVQLYAFDNECVKNNPELIFKQLAKIGYEAVEMPFAMDISHYTKEYGIKYSALHIGPDALFEVSKIVNHLHKNDCENICISGPLGWEDKSISNFEKTCGFLNEKAESLKSEGITVHYHNHDFEFQITNGIRPIDILLKKLEKGLINFCVDLGWINFVGIDPIKFLNEHKDRISHVHMRDFKEDKSVPLGKGTVNLKGIFEQLRKNNLIEYIIIEHEPEVGGIKELKISYDYLKSIDKN